MELTKAYGIIPIIISAVASAASLIFLYLISSEAISSEEIGIANATLANCNRVAVNILSSLIVVYRYISPIILAVSLITAVLFYIYDRRAFVLILIITVIFSGPFFAILDNSVLVITPTSLVRTCKSEFQSHLLALQYAIYFVSTYFLVGNVVLFFRRNFRSEGTQ